MSCTAAEAAWKRSAAWFAELAGEDFQAKLTLAFDWQIWCWGQDVARVAGNGLIQLGFERCSPPAEIKSASCYRRSERLPDGGIRRVALRANGAYFCEGPGQGIYVRRDCFAPCRHECRLYPPLQWTADRSIVIQAPADCEDQQQMQCMTLRLLRWIAGYEQQVERTFGAAHRRECRSGWKKPIPCGLEDSAAGWLDLAQQLERACAIRAAA